MAIRRIRELGDEVLTKRCKDVTTLGASGRRAVSHESI